MAKRESSKKTDKAANSAAMKTHLIDKYRLLIEKKYNVDTIKDNPDIPPSITPEIVMGLRKYFLDCLYPQPAKREKLDAAFAELENYIMHPAKVWDLLGNLATAIFRFGIQLPAALKTGLNALEAYTSVKHFENTLLLAATKKKLPIPMTDEELYSCISSIPKKQIDQFINEVGHLFLAISNTELLAKTITIMQDVLKQMKSKTDMYSSNEIEAIELGIDIMQQGHDLFTDYDDQLKQDILNFVTANETKFIEDLYKQYG